jgi:hypothetical protein
MTSCVYLLSYDGEAVTCPEETPDSARCSVCLLMLLLDKGYSAAKFKVVKAKLPS